jgi:predicted amino acid racemase
MGEPVPARATVTVDLGKVRANARTVVDHVPGISVVASRDHLILDVDALDRPPALGESLSFTPTYAATLQLFTSPYVHKVFTPPA